MPFVFSRSAIAAALAAAALVHSGPSQAQNFENLFKGRTVTIVHGFGVGGTYGLYGLGISRHLGRHVPGNPNIIVQSMPGAGGIKATNYAYNVMPKEGLYWFMPPDSIVISNLLQRDKVKYQADKFQYLGTSTQTNGVVVVRSDTGIRTVADLGKKQIIASSSGTGSQTFLIPALMNAVFDAKFRIVTGYKGSAGVAHAIEQKEADGSSLTWTAWNTVKPDWFKTGFARPIVQVGVRKDPRLPDLPLAVDLAKNADDRKIVNFISSLGPVGRGLALPPGVPKALVAALRQAFDATMADPAFLADAKDKHMDLDPMKGAELQGIIEDMMKISPELVDRAKTLIMDKGRGRR